MRKTLTTLISAGAIAAAIAGCGSSSATITKAAGVQLAPASGSTTESVTTASSTATTPTTPSVPTPTSGALSKEPTIAAGKGAQPTKLSTKDLVTGTGATAKAGDSITVNYVGVLYKNGKVFDSSWSRKQTATFTLSSGAVIAGWVKAIPGMKVGGRRELIIPASLAYGKTGQPPTIPANSALIFDVDLLKVTAP